jgi:hypothetical protein
MMRLIVGFLQLCYSRCYTQDSQILQQAVWETAGECAINNVTESD